MFVLIADSGSTKTDWVLLQGSTPVFQHKTIGFNPYFQTPAEIEAELTQTLLPALKPFLGKISRLYYYGTGCSTAENCELIEAAILRVIKVSEIHVAHDLLAAARALCKREWGIASILGTGSNSCLYNGETILENVPSTGYLWSDYGGGSQIGKLFIRDYFEDRLPASILNSFEEAGYNRDVILNNVYKKSVPGKYLASVSLFVSRHINEPYTIKLLNECFDSFFVQQIAKYTNSKNFRVHTVGSVGYFYREVIAAVAKRHGYTMGNVIQSPIEGLLEYHSH